MKLAPDLEAIAEETRQDAQPVPEPLQPLHYAAPLHKPEWVVDRYWKQFVAGPFVRNAGWIKHGGYATQKQAIQAATDMMKTKSSFVEKHRIRNIKTGEVIEL